MSAPSVLERQGPGPVESATHASPPVHTSLVSSTGLSLLHLSLQSSVAALACLPWRTTLLQQTGTSSSVTGEGQKPCGQSPQEERVLQARCVQWEPTPTARIRSW